MNQIDDKSEGALPTARATHEQSQQAVSAVPVGIANAGDVFTVAYPFFRSTYSALTEDGPEDIETWTPGVRFEPLPPYGEDAGAVADALGSMILTVVDCFKPGRYPARVFFTRYFIRPDGARFGKSKLHIATIEKFRRLASGFKHPFGIGEPLPPRWSIAESRRDFEELLAAHSAQGMETRQGGDGTAPSQDDSPVGATYAPNPHQGGHNEGTH